MNFHKAHLNYGNTKRNKVNTNEIFGNPPFLNQVSKKTFLLSYKKIPIITEGKQRYTTVSYSRKCSWPSQRGYSHLWRWSGETYRSYQKHGSVPLQKLFSTGMSFVKCSFYNKPKITFVFSVKTKNTAQNNCIISHAQNTIALQPNVFLTGIIFIGYW